MNAHTRISSKGQVVIPKAVRDRMGLRAGTGFEIVEQGRNLLLRTVTPDPDPLDWEEFCAIVPRYTGKPKTIEEISSVPEEALRANYMKKYP
jgi:AbrB family looped-hinge helix DNA binding protein